MLKLTFTPCSSVFIVNFEHVFASWDKMELFEKIVHAFQLLTIFSKIPILDIRLGSEYASEDG